MPKTNPFAVPFDLAECNRRCHASMANTPVGKWLAAACQEIERLRAKVAKLTTPVLGDLCPVCAGKIPFSLTCLDCDAGGDIDSAEEAIDAGWIDVACVLTLSNANYQAVCPDCQDEAKHEH